MSSYVPRAKSRRNTIKNGHGTAYIAIPPQWTYPDQITVNGTDYHSANTSALEDFDTNGKYVDLTDLGF